MKRKRQFLIRMLVVLLILFLVLGIGALFLAGRRRMEQREQKEQKKQQALVNLEKIPTVTPTPAVTATPIPTATPTPTPTPVPTMKPAFNPDDYWDHWYSTDGLATVNIYDISSKSVSFYFSQANASGTAVCEADIKAEVAGKAAQFSFTDSLGNAASGDMIFDGGSLFVKITTSQQNASVAPSVNCVMLREQPQVYYEPPATPTPVPQQNAQTGTQTGEYYFPDSDSRYLTDEELSVYSSADLELAKNEIYARHGRQFVTQRIADYFNSKSWYQGTVDPETFDAQQDSYFNQYESANISKIVEWEEKKRSEGN